MTDAQISEKLAAQPALKDLIADLRMNHEFCPKEVILQAADELERLAMTQPVQPATVAQQKDAVGAVEQDAKRYRFLREQDWFDSELCVLRDPKMVLTRGIGLGADCPSRGRLDVFIDAAIAHPVQPAPITKAHFEMGFPESCPPPAESNPVELHQIKTAQPVQPASDPGDLDNLHTVYMAGFNAGKKLVQPAPKLESTPLCARCANHGECVPLGSRGCEAIAQPAHTSKLDGGARSD